MSDRFIKFIPSEEAMWLAKKKGHAFRLLTIIAEAARRYEGGPDGLKIGECFIGGHKNYDMSEQNYRTAKEILVKRQHVEIVETCRTRKKSTNGTTTVSTKVKLLSTNVWDINKEEGNDRSNDRLTTDQRPTNDKLRKNKKDKKEKEDHPSIPSFFSDRADRDCGTTDDFSFEKEKIEICKGVFLTQEEIDSCVTLKGDREKVRAAIEFIQASKKRKHAITDWPNALANWKIENKAKVCLENHIALAEKLSKDFENFEDGHGWRCRLYADREKDQRGILFEYESPYKESIFIPFAHGEFEKKCDEAMKINKMRKIS